MWNIFIHTLLQKHTHEKECSAAYMHDVDCHLGRQNLVYTSPYSEPVCFLQYDTFVSPKTLMLFPATEAVWVLQSILK